MGNKRILAVAGSSGGHIFPALGFLHAIRDKHRDIELLFVLPESVLKKGLDIENKGIKTVYISVTSITTKCFNTCVFGLLKFIRGCIQSIRIILKFRPDIVVGFGSIVSVPLVVFSRILGADRIVIHEQNVIPGQANRFLARYADRIAVSFEHTRDYLEQYRFKTVFTGNILRSGLIEIGRKKALEYFGFEENKFTVLVMGGSQGSRSINKGFMKILRSLPEKCGFQVIHITGLEDYETVKRFYEDIPVVSRVFCFLQAMQQALSAADLVLCRGGATTISELIFYRIPAVIIPYPFAQRHQFANADVLKSAGCALVVEDSQLDGQEVQNILVELMNDRSNLEKMKSAYDHFSRIDSRSIFIDTVLR